MRETLSVAIAVAAFLALTCMTAEAREKENAFHPVGAVDLYTGTLVHADLHLGIGDRMTAVVPQLGFQYGFGSFAAGLDLGLSHADVDGLDSKVWLGNIVPSFKGRFCLGDSWRTCLGGELSLGIGLAETDAPDGAELEESAAEAFSLGAGLVADLRGRMFGAGVRHLGVEPILAASTTNGTFIVSGYAGPGIYTALDEIMVLGVQPDTGTEAALMYGASVGAVMWKVLGGTIGFRGFSTLTLDADRSLLALDATLRLLFNGISPVARVAVPLDDTARDIFDVVLSFGAAAEI